MAMQQRAAAFVIAVIAGAGACSDPVHSDAVDALGPEKRGVRPGPNHRPGQNCLTCHGGEGPGSPELVVAGTVYSARGFLEPLSNVIVEVRDANGDKRTPRSNEVGNFYIGKTDWDPVYPLTVKLLSGAAEENGVKAMESTIGRTAGCALCHYGETGADDHVPAVYLREKAL